MACIPPNSRRVGYIDLYMGLYTWAQYTPTLLNASIISQKLLMCNLLAVTFYVRVSVLVLAIASVQVQDIWLADFRLLVKIQSCQ